MTRAYGLFWTITGNPPGGIAVTADIPADWAETLDGMHSPSFAVPGMPGALIAIVAIHAPGASASERLAWAMAQQFGGELAEVTRAPRADGRLWAVHQPGGRLHARMFLPAPHDSVVMATAMTFTPAPAPAGWLSELERVFETVRVA